jgi:hypothetical protein
MSLCLGADAETEFENSELRLGRKFTGFAPELPKILGLTLDRAALDSPPTGLSPQLPN